MADSLASLLKNMDHFNDSVQGLLIAHRNMTAPLTSLAVDEALQGFSDHKLNRAGALENFRAANEDFEGSFLDFMLNMPDTVAPSLSLRSQMLELLEWPKRLSNETPTFPCFDYLEQFVNRASTKAPELSQFPQESSNAGSSRGVLPSSENLGLQGLLSISGHKRNMAEVLASLTESFQTVNEALEGLIIPHQKQNMAVALASLLENFRAVNEALEGLCISDCKLKMSSAAPSLTENFQTVNVALQKAKEYLLQSVQNPSRNMAERQEFSQLSMILKMIKEAELIKDSGLNDIAERACKSDDMIAKMAQHKKETAQKLKLLDSMMPSDGKCNKAPDVTRFPREFKEFKNAGNVSWSPRLLQTMVSKSHYPGMPRNA